MPFGHAVEGLGALGEGVDGVDDGDDLVLVDEVNHVLELLVGPHGAAEDGDLTEEDQLGADVLPVAACAAVKGDPAARPCEFDQIREAISSRTVDNHIKPTCFFVERFGPVVVGVVGAACATHVEGAVDLFDGARGDMNFTP